jgi:hypothetical protein
MIFPDLQAEVSRNKVTPVELRMSKLGLLRENCQRRNISSVPEIQKAKF